MSNLDNRIANADQLLTTDIDKFCESATDLYSNISKPVLDIFIYVYRLTVNLGGKTPSILMLYLLFAGVFLTRLRRPTGRLTVEEQKLEGEFRYVNSRLITNSEEVAFYQGNVREKLTLLASYSKLRSHLRKFLEFRVSMGIIDNIIGKCMHFPKKFLEDFKANGFHLFPIQTLPPLWASTPCPFPSLPTITRCCPASRADSGFRPTTPTAACW